jgi:NAD(P)-dependent dehydrogenase (short-subunit alcohol dehydrogenase family)
LADRPSVLITGASSGLGAAMAARMISLGWRVFGTSRKPRIAAQDGSSVGAAAVDPASIEWIAMDVCDDGSVEHGLAEVFARSPRLDGLVCNAGFGIYGSVEETSLERARAQFETNVFGVLRVARPVIARMRARGAGRLLFVGSLSGRAPIPFQAHYSATKAAIEALAFSLANEVRPFGLAVSLIEPGDIDTAFNDVMDWGEPPPTSAYRDRQKRCETTIRESLPKAPKPGIVADAVAHALTSKHPRLRYAVGNEARLVGLGKRLLSDRLNLKLIRDHFGI